jgi:hypothetical protein
MFFDTVDFGCIDPTRSIPHWNKKTGGFFCSVTKEKREELSNLI